MLTLPNLRYARVHFIKASATGQKNQRKSVAPRLRFIASRMNVIMLSGFNSREGSLTLHYAMIDQSIPSAIALSQSPFSVLEMYPGTME